MDGIGERIRELRKTTGMTQVNFAKVLGIHHGHLANLELSKSKPSEHLLLLICERFDTNLEWLKDGAGPMKSDPNFDPERAAEAAFEKRRAEVELEHLIKNMNHFKLMQGLETPMLLWGFQRALEYDPAHYLPELIGELKDFLSLRDKEPFESAQKLYEKLESYAAGEIRAEGSESETD